MQKESVPGPASLVSKARDTATPVWPGMTAGPGAGPARLTLGLVWWAGAFFLGTNAHFFRDYQNLFSLQNS